MPAVLSAQAQRGPRPELDVTAYLNWHSFAPYLNSVFCFLREDGSTSRLRLEKIPDTRLARARKATPDVVPDCLMLTLRSSSSAPLEQGAYMVTRAALGEFEMFITVSGGTVKQRRYYAVFNRMAS
jgi:hypothetical protein